MIIRPTNTCFDDSLDFLSHRVMEDPRDEHSLILVHAVVLSSLNYDPPNEPYAHAWVEEGPLVWDSGKLEGQRVYYAIPREQYYAEHRPQKMSRYSVRMAIALNYRFNNFGPWRKEYSDLCTDNPRITHAISGVVKLLRQA